MKEKLLKRLEDMNQEIDAKHKQLQQANADLNVLNGHRMELVHILSLCDEVKEPEKLHDVNNEVLGDPDDQLRATA